MVLPSIFPSKTNRFPRQRHMAAIYIYILFFLKKCWATWGWPATPILAKGVAQPPPSPLGGGSATPKGQSEKKMFWPPTFFFFKKKPSNKKKYGSHVSQF
jgi:hypothetical protein